MSVGGPLGALARRLVYAVRMPTAEQRRVATAGLFTAALGSLGPGPAAASAMVETRGAAATGTAATAAGTPLARWLKKSRA